MIAVIRHWKLKKGVKEEEWVKYWDVGTKYLLKNYGSLGAAMHRAEDGTYWVYARWPDMESLGRVKADVDAGRYPYPNDEYVETIEHTPLELIKDNLKK
jgi:hypothetical protein